MTHVAVHAVAQLARPASPLHQRDIRTRRAPPGAGGQSLEVGEPSLVTTASRWSGSRQNEHADGDCQAVTMAGGLVNDRATGGQHR